MAKRIEENTFTYINKNKVDQYDLTGKVRNYVLHNDAVYILRNPRNKIVGYYVFKMEHRHYQLKNSFFEEKYEKYIPQFEQLVLKDMKWKILLQVSKGATVNHTTIQARPTFIPHIDLLMIIFGIVVAIFVTTQEVALPFLIGIILAYFFGTKTTTF